jgi:hypothetical protein
VRERAERREEGGGRREKREERREKREKRGERRGERRKKKNLKRNSDFFSRTRGQLEVQTFHEDISVGANNRDVIEFNEISVDHSSYFCKR